MTSYDAEDIVTSLRLYLLAAITMLNDCTFYIATNI